MKQPIDHLNPHVTREQLKAFYKKAPPFAMPPPEGIIPPMCRALERAIRNPYVWGKKTHFMIPGYMLAMPK